MVYCIQQRMQESQHILVGELCLVHINHVAIATQNLYEAAFRLRSETGLGFYDGGWSQAGTGSKIVPLGGGSYLQLSSVVNASLLDDPSNSSIRRLYESAKGGDRFESLNLRVDTLEELESIGAPFGMKPGHNDRAGRISPNGDRIQVMGLLGGTGMPAGSPNFYYFPELYNHPSGQPVEPAYGLVKPSGVAWMEVGGSADALAKLIGERAKDLPLRFNGKASGVYAIAVRMAEKEVVIRRRSASDA
jgi:hypothetical protein